MILWRNIEKYPFFINLIPTPDSPHFFYMLGGNLGSLLYGDVSVMKAILVPKDLCLVNFGLFRYVMIPIIFYVHMVNYRL